MIWYVDVFPLPRRHFQVLFSVSGSVTPQFHLLFVKIFNRVATLAFGFHPTLPHRTKRNAHYRDMAAAFRSQPPEVEGWRRGIPWVAMEVENLSPVGRGLYAQNEEFPIKGGKKPSPIFGEFRPKMVVSNSFWDFPPGILGKWSNLRVAYFFIWVGKNHQL